MDLVGVSLEILLAVLLLAALAYGVRLERRLKALREGQGAFAQAVRELDQSVMKAQAGLAELRKAGEEAHAELHDRILKAREAKADLERLIARAERVRITAPVAAPAPVAPPVAVRTYEEPLELVQPVVAPRAPMAAPTPTPTPSRSELAAERVAAAILGLGDLERLLSEPAPEVRLPHRAESLRAESLRAEPPRAEPLARPRRIRGLDEDLFDALEPRPQSAREREPAPPVLRRAVGVGS